MFLLLFAISAGIIGIDMDYSIHSDIATLNNEFQENSFLHKFENKSWGWSWSAAMVQNNFIVGVVNLNGDQHEEKGGLSLDLSFRSRVYEVGYVLNLSHVLAYLRVGGGYSHVHMTASSHSDSATFFGVLKDPGESAYLTASSFSLSSSAGIIIPLTDYMGIRLGGGYIHGLKNPNWKFADGKELYEDPEMDLRHIYIKAGIVLGEFKG